MNPRGLTAEALVRDHLAPRRVLAQPTPGEAALQSPGYGFGHGVAVYLTQAPGASRQRYRRLITQWVYRAVDG